MGTFRNELIQIYAYQLKHQFLHTKDKTVTVTVVLLNINVTLNKNLKYISEYQLLLIYTN